MANRLTRDQLCHAGLDLADLPALDQHDRPHGVIVEGAHAVNWLQAGLDVVHELWPWGALLKKQTVSIVANTDVYGLPTDFVLDFPDGLRVDSTVGTSIRTRARKVGLSKILDAETTLMPGTTLTQYPIWYTLHGINPSPSGVTGFASRLQLWPVPDRAYTGTLYYYSLPSVLTSGEKVPTFPSDYILIEWVRLRGLEWARQLEPGTHLKYLETLVGQFQRAGLGREADTQDIPLDPKVFRRAGGQNQWAWLGSTTVAP